MNELKKYINKIIDLSDREMDIFTSLFTEVKLKKGEYFSKEGDLSTKLGFVVAGVMRAFVQNNEGDEYNKTFFTNSSFVAAYSSLVTQQRNLINIQCLTDCSILLADFKRITSLYTDYPKIERLSRMFAEYKFAIKEKREIELVTLNASERYEIFRKEHPHLENKIPQYHIASYLGITPTQLSRIRAKR